MTRFLAKSMKDARHIRSNFDVVDRETSTCAACSELSHMYIDPQLDRRQISLSDFIDRTIISGSLILYEFDDPRREVYNDGDAKCPLHIRS